MLRAGRRDIIPFSGWTTTATTSSRLPPDVLISYHIVQHAVASPCILQTLPTHTQVELEPLLLQLQCLLLLLVDVQPSHRAPVPHNLRFQRTIPDATNGRIDYVRRWVIAIEHAEGTVRHVLDRLVVVGCGVKLGTVVSAVECESTYDVRISGHMYLNEPRWCRDAMLVSDGEGDEIFPYVVDESFGGLNRYCCASRCCARISWGGRWPYRFGSRNSSRLPSSSSSTYTHPLGRSLVGRDECWRRYFDGIFVVFIDESGNLSRQRGDVRVREANSGHVGMWRSGRSDKYG